MKPSDIKYDGRLSDLDKQAIVAIVHRVRLRSIGEDADRFNEAFDTVTEELICRNDANELDDPQAVAVIACEFLGFDPEIASP